MTYLGGIVDFCGFISDHWKEISSMIAVAALLIQQWKATRAAKAAAKLAQVAVSVAVTADDDAKQRDEAKIKKLEENTTATLETLDRTKTIEKTTNGEKTARIAHIELLEGLLRNAGLPVPPKPPILG